MPNNKKHEVGIVSAEGGILAFRKQVTLCIISELTFNYDLVSFTYPVIRQQR